MNICICGHTQDEHEYGLLDCRQCDCEVFKASTDSGEYYDAKDWGDE